MLTLRPMQRQLPTSHIRITSRTFTMKARTLTQKKKTAHLIKVRREKTIYKKLLTVGL